MTPGSQRRSPYQGLIPYAEEDAPFFFGRQKETRLLAANLFAVPFTLLYGASGTGKSSVLRAGLLNYLRPRKDLFVVIFHTWQGNPLVDFKNALTAAEARLHSQPPPPTDSQTLSECLCACAKRLERRLMVILDQFEEYFIYHPADDDFAAEFPPAVRAPDSPVSFLISIREDALAKLDRFEGSIPNLFDNYLRIEHLTRPAAQAAIEKPIEEYNRLPKMPSTPIAIEPALVGAVLEQVQTGRVLLGEAGRGMSKASSKEPQIETPYLQLVLNRLWDEEMRAGSRHLRQETLERLGGAERIVRTHLDEVMDKLLPQEKEIAARVFRYLVTPSGTKIAHFASDLAEYAELGKEELVPVLDKLTSGSFFILRRVTPMPDQPDLPQYEIFHDVIAPAILDWRARYAQANEQVESERKIEEQRRRAEEQARVAQRLRSLSVLLTVFSLIAILAASMAIYQWQAANQQRSIALTKAEEAKKQERIATANAQETKRQQIVALAQAQEAESQRRIAQSNLEKYQQEEKRRLQVEQTAGETDEQRRIALSGQLAEIALSFVQVDPELGVLLAKEAALVARTTRAEEALRKTLLASHIRAIMYESNAVTSAKFSPDGKFVVSVSMDRAARVWSALTGELVRELKGHADSVTQAAFSPDGRFIVTASKDHAARVWQAPDWQSLRELKGHADAVDSAEFSPDGKFIVTASRDKTALVWETVSGRKVAVLDRHKEAVFVARFSPDGRLIVTASEESGRVWEVPSWRYRTSMSAHSKERVFSAEFSPDSKRIVSAIRDGAAREWDASSGALRYELTMLSESTEALKGARFSPDSKFVVTARPDGLAVVFQGGQPLRSLKGHAGPINQALFSSNSRFVVTASSDSTARIWSARTWQEVAVLRGHTNAVNSAEFSPDSQLVVTAGADRTVRVWGVPEEQTVAETKGSIEDLLALVPKHVTRQLTAQERGNYLHPPPR